MGFDGLPWVARAQREHDVLTDVLAGLGAEVIYLTELLHDVLEYAKAREAAIASALASSELGGELKPVVRRYLEALQPEDLASVLIAGLGATELRTGHGLVYDLLDPHDFVIDPLPNLVFSRDASAVIADQVVIGALPGPRRRESDLLGVVYSHHPRFIGVKPPYQAKRSRLDCGDLLLLAPGVVAVGVGVGTTPAGAELLAGHLLEAGIAETVLVVPMARCGSQERGRAARHLDTVCTVLDHGVVLMAPAVAFTMTALTITMRTGQLRVSRPRPFLEAAARAIEIDKLTVIDTGANSVASSSGQWEDGGNALVVGGRTIICDERNTETNARLAAAGFEVITVPCGELGGVRGGPRAMCVPMLRAPEAVSGRAPADGDRSRPGLSGQPPAQRSPAADHPALVPLASGRRA
jgi:arginine deiminase